jgi:dolichol-phosphate mannosyltransferase
LGSAYIRGFKESLYDDKDIIFEMDADLSHNPEYIMQFIKKIEEGFDLVIGEREKIVGWRFYRKMISMGGNFIGRNLAGIKIKDLTTGYRAYRRDVLSSMNLDKIESDGYAFQLETLFRSLSNGFKVGSVPIVFYDRESGKSKLSKWDIVKFFVLALKIRLGLIDV